MKIFSTISTLLLIFAFSANHLLASPESKEKLKGVPENVKAIIENSCYGCHNSDSKNEDAREELNFDKMDNLSKIKKIGTFKHISEVIEENEMPPKKFLQRYPDKKLSDAEKQIIMDWAKKEAEALIKK